MISLKQLIVGHFKKIFLIPVLTLELALLLMYFLVNDLVISDARKELLFERSQNVYEHLSIQAQDLNSQFLYIRQLVELLQRQHQDYFSEDYNWHHTAKNPAEFKMTENGVYVKAENNSGSSVFISQMNARDSEARRKAQETEYWDAQLKYTAEQSHMVLAAYFNSYDNLNRYYPFIDDVQHQFPTDMVISNFNFYYLADYSHNPNRGVVWTPAYLDPAGQGWLVSAVVPIYNSNFLEGVTGVDISLDSMVKEIERLMLPFNGESFLVDEQGRMISMSSGTQNLLNLQQLSKGVEGQKVHRDTEQPEEFLINRLPYSSFRDTISNMFSYDERTKFAEHDGVTYLIASHPISETGWTLFSITNADKVLIRINELDKMSREFGIMAISLMILFYLLFYYIVQRQSQVLSNKIAEPLGDLSNNVKSAARARRLQSIHSSGIEEVEDLTNNLTSMVAELNKQADNINRSHQRLNEEISYRERLEQQVGTDEVTHLLNRRGLLQQGEIVLQQAVKMRQPMSMLLFEISGYPQIIEQHGSQEAEQVLLQCAECCRALAPDHALMAHLSTAQFVAILPNTAREQAINLSRRIRSEIYLTVELGGSAATVSTHFAVTEAALSHYESLLVMIDRSQQLLERSRRNRNLVIETDSKTE